VRRDRSAPSNASGSLASETPTPAGDQVDHQDYQRNHKEQVNQATRNVQAKAQNPKNQQNDKNRPEHTNPLFAFAAPETQDPGRP
jgi:hypothetical protein